MKYNKRSNRWEAHYSLVDTKSGWRERLQWCLRTFGAPTINTETGMPKNWGYHGGYIYLYDEKHVTMYLLRWS